MKMNKFALISVAFLFGAISAISLVALYSFTGMGVPSPSVTGVSPVTAADANTLVKAYLKTAAVPLKPAKGFYLDMQELAALNALAAKDSKLSGFRIYFGKESNGPAVGLVVGVDANNLDLTKSILKAQSPKTGLCPPVCDNSSPIIKE